MRYTAVMYVGTKVTATVAGLSSQSSQSSQFLTPLLKDIGRYPHGGMVVNPKHKAQSTRMVKVMCAGCGFVLRTTRVRLESISVL